MAGFIATHSARLSLVRSLAVLFALFCGLHAAVQAETCAGPVYHVQRAGEPDHLLVGTLHIGDSRLAGVLACVERYLPLADRLVLELELDVHTIAKATKALVRSQPADLDAWLSASQQSRLLEALGPLGIDARAVRRFKPWALAATLNLGDRQGGGLDLALFREARLRGLKVSPLETVAEQTAMMDALPEALQWEMVLETLNHLDEARTVISSLIDAYLADDLARLVAISEREYQGAPPEVGMWFRERLIMGRNQRMLERVLPLMKEGPSIIAVGALHLTGGTGLIAGLRLAGYRVEAVGRDG